MDRRTITATRLKARLLAVLDEVDRSGIELVVTKHGRPVARLVPPQRPVSLAGSISYLVGDEELLAPLDERWDASAG